MKCIDNVTYYSVEEIVQREGNVLTKEGIAAFLDANPSFGLEIDGCWHSYDLAIDFMDNLEKFKTHFLAGALGFDFSSLQFNGLVLDIGAGGEGIIGQATGGHAIGIAPEEHKRGLERAPGCALKIMMDSRDMKFLDNSFDTATAFYTLMYIDNIHHEKVFSEIYRVLKPGGEFFLWDMAIPVNSTDKTGYMMGIEVQLKDKKVFTGYGAKWPGKQQSAEYFKGITGRTGFQVLEEECGKHLIYLKLVKPKNPTIAVKTFS